MVELGAKVGVKVPLLPFPTYLVGSIQGMGQRFTIPGYYSDYYIQYNSYVIGPGLTIYPLPMINLGASLGYAFTSNQTDLPGGMLGSEGGFGMELSGGYEMKFNHANNLLVGVKYVATATDLEGGIPMNQGGFFVFGRYVRK